MITFLSVLNPSQARLPSFAFPRTPPDDEASTGYLSRLRPLDATTDALGRRPQLDERIVGMYSVLHDMDLNADDVCSSSSAWLETRYVSGDTRR